MTEQTIPANSMGEFFRSSLAAQFVRALDLHKAEIRRLRAMVCECGHAEDFHAHMHDEDCPARPPGLAAEESA